MQCIHWIHRQPSEVSTYAAIVALTPVLPMADSE
jgi:hypothetical protein